MSATQPFLSGAISKTVNLPQEATIEDIAEAYAESWRQGIKAVAIYRDGSKGTQPLNTSMETKRNRAAAETLPDSGCSPQLGCRLWATSCIRGGPENTRGQDQRETGDNCEVGCLRGWRIPARARRNRQGNQRSADDGRARRRTGCAGSERTATRRSSSPAGGACFHYAQVLHRRST